TAAAVAIAGLGGPPELVAGVAAAGFALAQTLWSIANRLQSPAPAGPGSGPVGARERLARQRRSVGGLVVHAGVALMALAIVATGVGRRELVATLAPGDSAVLGSYRVTFTALREATRPDRTVVIAEASATGPGGSLALDPSLSAFATSTQAIATPSISSSILGDLYVTLMDVDRSAGTATLRIGLHPFMSWLWFGGGIAALGGVVAAWPARRRPIRGRAPLAAAAAPPAIAGLGADE
ncbi:MAG: hypothetical protein HY264_01535, partial [Chloroflexi bacterium]|nr:hypothetical protein [Chloroflexota bacterium]